MSSKRITFNCYTIVHNVIKGDNALKRALSNKMFAVCRQDQTHEDFPHEVDYVLQQIHGSGMDVRSMSKKDILRWATRLLLLENKPIPEPCAIALAPPPPPPPKEENKSVTAKAKTKKAKATKAKASPKTVTEEASRPKVEATVESPAAVDQSPAGDSSGLQFVRKCVPYVPGIAIMSNLFAASQLMGPFITVDPVMKDISQKLSALTDEVHRATIMPSAETKPSNAG